jgi:hypothetical protein
LPGNQLIRPNDSPAEIDLLRTRLEEFDPDGLSPREALEALYELKALAGPFRTIE